MKPVVKYPLTVFILALVGYTQLFAHLYRGTTFNCAKKINGTGHDQSVVIEASEQEDIYVEEREKEEYELTFLEECSKYKSAAFFYTPVMELFCKHSPNGCDSSNRFSSISFFRSPYRLLCVLRL